MREKKKINRLLRLGALLSVFALVAAACGDDDTTPETVVVTSIVTEVEERVVTEEVVVTSIVTEVEERVVTEEVIVEVPVEVEVMPEPMGPTGPGLLDLDDSELAGMSWDEIVAAAAGGRVNWFMWGGSAVINAYVNDWVSDEAKSRYNIDLNQVRITDTVNAVDTVISETEAGEFSSGSIDLIWINGENFKTMKNAGLLFCGYWDIMPSMANVDQMAATNAFDFGTAVDECEVPWNQAQSAVFYNSALVPEPPADMDALLAAACANPGTFTYPAPPDFTGSVFVRHVFYNEADKILPGGHQDMIGIPFDQALYDQVATATWQTLNDLEPCLWRSGETYPVDQPALEQLYSNSEVTHFLAYGPASAGSKVESGVFPESTRTYGLDSGQIGNTNFVAIPYNSPNKAATLVVADLLLSIDGQLQKAYPDVWGQINVLNAASQVHFSDVPRHPSVVDPAEVTSLGELLGDWVPAIEEGWKTNVAEQ
ncbi:MAG: ABC transporter substrate-binding protein [Acidimicrobiia bacterium]|nr:ABC transporter substrate-binding protein [Acidimicrobiia bacterium]